MRDRPWLFVFAAVACGRELGPAPGTTDAGADAGSPIEERVTTFACGGNVCIFDTHACCLATSTCAPIQNGCPVEDAGADAAPPPPPLLCTTYRNCTGELDRCCFSPDAGSQCTSSSCANIGAVRLCTLGQDNCGEDHDCKSFAESPAPATIGQCVNAD